jgi:hypothetical protein
MKFPTPGFALLSVLALFPSIGRSADVPTPVKRIDYALNLLIGTYGGRTDYANLITLGFQHAKNSEEDVRSLLFRVEGLLNLYSEDYPQLVQQSQGAIKGLEDHIGHYDDAVNFYNQAVQGGKASADTIAQLKKKMDDEKAQYLVDIQGWGGNSAVPKKIQMLVHTTFGPTASDAGEKKDRAILLTQMIKYVNKLDKNTYDFTHLEGGIHQLRRDARNMDNYPFAMSGVINWDTSSCPNAAWKNLMPLKPITPIAPIKDVCNVSACLDGLVSNVQNNLAGIKQTAVVENARLGRDLDFVSPQVLSAAQVEFNRMKAAPKALDLIRMQLQKCL